MRIVDLHCYPGTPEWIACQGPYVEALAKYWNRQWVGKSEDEVLKDFTDAGVEAVLVALDLETTIATPPVTNDYVHAMWKRHPQRIIQAWGAVEPAKGETAIHQVRKAVRELGLIGFHFHPIMQHFAVDDRRYYPLFEEIASLGAAVMIDVGTTGMGAGLPGGMGAVIRHAHPASIDHLSSSLMVLATPPSGTSPPAVQTRALSTSLRKPSTRQLSWKWPPVKAKPRPPSRRFTAQATSCASGSPGMGVVRMGVRRESPSRNRIR